MQKKKGISLIVLVITIIVIIILAGAVILSLSNNNPIAQANEATFKSNLHEYSNELSLYLASEYAKNKGALDLSTINATGVEVKQIITSIATNDVTKYSILGGRLYYTGSDTNELLWGKQQGIIDAEVYKFSATEGVNKPKLVAGLTPVKWNGSSWVNTTESDALWYNYTAQASGIDGTSEWANAKSNDGSMWVWIPRYAYKILTPGTSTQSEILIEFLQGTTYNKADGTKVASDYIVHPAFTSNVAQGGWDKELPGIWVAKFESGYAVQAQGDTEVESPLKYTETYNMPSNVYGLITSGSTVIKYPVFKPNKYSYNYIDVGDMYNISRNLTTSGNPYGFTQATADSHLMKNSEWGAVTYLAHSKYGRNGNQVRNNNCNVNNVIPTVYGVTGMGATTDGEAGIDNKDVAANQYNGQYGKLASTTGNVYGVYDMSGGARETVAGYINSNDQNLSECAANIMSSNGQGITTKYVTSYAFNSLTNTSIENYNMPSNITRKGEAIWETSTMATNLSGWFGDYTNFIAGVNVWMDRGGAYTNNPKAGLFTFALATGNVGGVRSFRPVLAPM